MNTNRWSVKDALRAPHRALVALLFIGVASGCRGSVNEDDLSDDASVDVLRLPDAGFFFHYDIPHDISSRPPDRPIAVDVVADRAVDAPAVDVRAVDAPSADVARDVMRTDGGCGSHDEYRRCAGDHGFDVCVGGWSPPVTHVDCAAGERCAMRGGFASCMSAGACRNGSARCADRATVERCVGGAWTREPCALTCIGGALGAACVQQPPMRTLHGALRYWRRPPAEDLLSWRDPVERPARGFVVHAWRGGEIVGRGMSDETGRFEVNVPARFEAGDEIEAVAAAGEDGHVTVTVGDAGLSPGTHSVEDPVEHGVSWAWRWPVPAEGATLTIPLETSPAASAFDDLRMGYAATRARMATAPRDDLVAWVRRGVGWDCGSCFFELRPITVGGQRFDSQIWIGGDRDEAYWADAVVLHEFGHWVMSSWGTIPLEGGAHYLGYPTMPGQAWAEGWASWVSSDLRDDPRLYSVSRGTFFWVDFARRVDYRGRSVARPDPNGALQQPLDESEVVATLWSLTHGAQVDRPSSAEVFRLITTARMNTSPFGRCYQRHSWRSPTLGDACSTGESSPFLADLLDAARCGGASAETIRAANEMFPYPGATPICEAGADVSRCPSDARCGAYDELDPPFVARWIADPNDARHLTARIENVHAFGTPVRVSIESPPGAVLRGPSSWTVTSDQPRDVEITLTATGAGPLVLRAELDAGWARARAAVPWWP